MMLLLQISAFQDAFGLSIEVGPSAGADDSLAAESTVPKFRKPLVGKPELKLCTVTVANRFLPCKTRSSSRESCRFGLSTFESAGVSSFQFSVGREDWLILYGPP